MESGSLQQNTSHRSKALGLTLVWALFACAVAGTYYLSENLRNGGQAAVFLSSGTVQEVGLYKDHADPVRISAKAGDEILFIVKDESYHDIVEERKSRGDARLESGELKRDESYSLVFSEKGLYSFYDRLDTDIRIEIEIK